MNKNCWSSYSRTVAGVFLGTSLIGPLSGVALGQSLWKAETSYSMVADKRARAVGDILTILVQESNTASKDNSTKTSKQSGVDASIDTFLYGPQASGLLTKGGQYPGLKFNAKTDFAGAGTINNSEQITARIWDKLSPF